MGRDSRRRVVVTLASRASAAAMLSLTLTVALTVTLTAVAVSPSAASPKKGTALAKKPKLAEAGHATFWDCPSKTTELLVVVNTLTLHPGATLTVSFTVRNGGTTSCNYTAPYAGVVPGPTSTSLTAGPCGSVGYEIENSHHHNVWPGRAGRELSGTRLCAAGGGRHRVGHRFVEPDRTE